MEFHNVVIGEGNPGNSWTSFRMWGNISRNDVSFLVHVEFLGMSVTVFRNTPVGVELAEKISANVPDAEIIEWITDIAIPLLPVSELRQSISAAIKSAFESGRKDKAAEIRNVLGVTP